MNSHSAFDQLVQNAQRQIKEHQPNLALREWERMDRQLRDAERIDRMTSEMDRIARITRETELFARARRNCRVSPCRKPAIPREASCQ